ncbi:MAG: HAD-IIB family hydrolase [Erysipelotrichaceae bacterium]|nr:HAD-IIB family hydrolase [Erysipelotrichaceae bacterium]
MIKGALFDIDDTLFSHDIKAVPKATLRMLDKLREKGIKIGICTSRIVAEMAAFPEELDRRIDCKIMGTGSVTYVKDRYLKTYALPMEDAKKYTDYFHAHNISYHYTDINGDLYYWGDLDKVNNGRWLRFAEGNVKFKPYEDEEISNLFYYDASDEDVINIDKIDPEAMISKWGNYGNINTPLVDKSFGLMKFCQMFSFTTDEVVAAGDGGNDDVMLEMAGIGIAVDDAKDNTKAKADYICKKSIENGGLYDAFVDLGIIEEDHYDMDMFVFDNDGTLFDHSFKGVSESTYEGLRKLKEKGKILCMNTSRSYEEMKNIPQRLIDMMDVIILLDGAYIIYKDKKEVSYIDDEDLKKIIECFKENDIAYRYALDSGKGYINKHDEEKEGLFRKLYDFVPPVKEYEGERVCQIIYYAADEILDKVLEIAKNEENFILFNAAEISPSGKTKGLSMIEVGRHFGIAREHICAFGDSNNDTDMMKKAGLGIAMGNGSLECRIAADYVADDITEDGLYKALVHFGFIED